jgi:FtsH-binding integral membrane protein
MDEKRPKVNPLDYSHFLLWTGDLCFVAGLILMAMVSAAAAQKIGRGVRVPMQFGLTGKPIWSAPRRFALLFAPALAAGFGLFLTFMAHTTDTGDLTKQALSLGTSRVGMALAFVVAHIAHLAIALNWLGRQK